jgi:glycosyltransferase involved in cell wall biosynthesis
MSSVPLVSIVVPTYNRARLIGEAIDSALQQTWRNLEVLIVDDGSTDDTARIVDEWTRRDERVQYFVQKNRGVSAARNRALAEARGSFVAFLDSDDAWYPWKLEVQLGLLTARPELVMCWTDMEAVDPQGETRYPRYLRRMYSAYHRLADLQPFEETQRLGDIVPTAPAVVQDARCGWGHLYSRMLAGNLVHTSTVLLRREIAREVGWFDETMRRGGEDFKYHLTTCRLGPVALIDVPSIRYRIGDDDRITHPKNSVHFARSFLRTISDELRDHRDQLELPSRDVSRVLCEAHQWLAEAELENQHRGRAAWHALHSMWHGRSPGAAWKPLVKSLLPNTLVNALRKRQQASEEACTSPAE